MPLDASKGLNSVVFHCLSLGLGLTRWAAYCFQKECCHTKANSLDQLTKAGLEQVKDIIQS